MHADVFGTWTGSISLDLSGGLGYGGGISIAFVFDGEGNLGFQFNTAKGGTMMGSLGASLSGGYTNNNTIFDLEGTGYSFGGSGGYLGYGGIDFSADERGFDGISVSVGIGIGAEIHGYETQTYTLWSNNPNPNSNTAASKNNPTVTAQKTQNKTPSTVTSLPNKTPSKATSLPTNKGNLKTSILVGTINKPIIMSC